GNRGNGEVSFNLRCLRSLLFKLLGGGRRHPTSRARSGRRYRRETQVPQGEVAERDGNRGAQGDRIARTKGELLEGGTWPGRLEAARFEGHRHPVGASQGAH